MPIEASEFRRVLAHWSTGVAIVATRTPAGEPCGMTATAFASVSLSPPLVLACLERGADTHEAVRAARVFSINILAHDHEALSRRFAGDDPVRKFSGVSHHAAPTGAPVLDDALAWVDCRVHAAHAAGDHTIFIGLVMSGFAREGDPLIYYRGAYTRLPQ
ncbi:MAG TPA: flavin reductase family protein [Longimicrobiales bacterium]